MCPESKNVFNFGTLFSCLHLRSLLIYFQSRWTDFWNELVFLFQRHMAASRVKFAERHTKEKVHWKSICVRTLEKSRTSVKSAGKDLPWKAATKDTQLFTWKWQSRNLLSCTMYICKDCEMKVYSLSVWVFYYVAKKS